jgi:hypothetical protein
MADNFDQVPSDIGRYATEVQTRDGQLYEPPKGFPILDLPKDAVLYNVGQPTKQTDLLVGFERRYIIPIAVLIGPIFDQDPKPDDVYRATPEYAKNNLHVIFSRTGVKRIGNLLNWDAIVVIVQKMCIVRVNCDLDPNSDKFGVRALYLWSRANQEYSEVKDPAGAYIDPSVLPYILERYVELENILPR